LVRRVEEDKVALPAFGETAENLVHEVPVGIDEPQSLALREVFEDHRGEKRGLSGARGADHIGVSHAEIAREADRARLSLVEVLSERDPRALRHGRGGFGAPDLPAEPRET